MSGLVARNDDMWRFVMTRPPGNRCLILCDVTPPAVGRCLCLSCIANDILLPFLIVPEWPWVNSSTLSKGTIWNVSLRGSSDVVEGQARGRRRRGRQ